MPVLAFGAARRNSADGPLRDKRGAATARQSRNRRNAKEIVMSTRSIGEKRQKAVVQVLAGDFLLRR